MSPLVLAARRATRRHEAGLSLITHRGRGASHFLLVPGLVPDGPETFLRQIPLLRRHGDVTVVSYPREHFDLDALLDVLRQRTLAAASSGRRPVLVGVSVGGGFCLELLRRARLAREEIPLRALVLISPLTCREDLAPLLQRMLAPLLDVSNPDLRHEALERGRAFFRALAQRSAPAATAEQRWPSWVRPLMDRGQERVRERITRTLAEISPDGGIERCRAVARLVGLGKGALCSAPTLLLWASKERHTLDVNGPGVAHLNRPDLATRYFPRAEVQWVYSADGSEVPHASLLLHHRAFNFALARFLRRRSLYAAPAVARPLRVERPAFDDAAATPA